MTKYLLAEQIQRILLADYANRDNVLTIQELMVSVSQEYAQVVKLNWFQGKNDGVSEIEGVFVYTFKNRPVLKDEDTGRYYSEIPSSYLSLPHELGIRMVAEMKGDSQPFIRVPLTYLALTRNLTSITNMGRSGFYVEGKNIYFVNYNKAEKVMFKLAIALEETDADDEIQIPPDIQSQIIDKVLTKYGYTKQIPIDNTNNSNSQK